MICELAHIIHPAQAGRRYMAVLTLKFDESYKTKTLVIGGWIGNDTKWKRRQSLWQKAISFENKTLAPERSITRYHAAEMNANDGEYEGWETEGPRKLRFTKKLLNVSGKSKMIPVAVGIDLVAFRDIFPEQAAPGPIGNAYLLCMKALMEELGKAMALHQPEDRLAIIHDHGDWDVQALQSYNEMVDTVEWEHRHRFVSITPLTWREDVGLQSADLFAYESMRYLDDHNWEGDMRKPLQVLFGLLNRAAFGFKINRKYLELLREELERTGKLEPLRAIR